MNHNPLTSNIVNDSKQLASTINTYNTNVLLTFLQEELCRDYDKIRNLKIEKHKIVMMISKLKKEVIKEAIVLDIEELNKVF